MSNSTTTTVYIQVIEDVVTKIRQEFINNAGPGEGVLNQLQGLWELKMMQAGGIFDRSSSVNEMTPSNAVRDLNVPYEGPHEYETPTADLLFPPTPLQTPMPGQTPLPGTVDTSYNIPTGGTPITPNVFSPMNENGGLDNRVGRPSPHMQPPVSWLNQRRPLDVNVAYVDGHAKVERGSASQPMNQDFRQVPSGKRKREDFSSQFRPNGYIPQQDGAGDIYNYQGVVSEDYNVANTPAPPELQARTPAMVNQNDVLDDDEDEPLNENDDEDEDLDDVEQGEELNTHHLVLAQFDKVCQLQARTPAMVNQNDVLDDDEDEPLNENDDEDEDLDDVEQGEELNTHHLVLAQFDKVTRTKSKWKCSLKDGIMHINNKDVLFNKASGEFDF